MAIEIIKMQEELDSQQTVEISLEEYRELTEKAFLSDMILDALYDNATLSYDGKGLAFSGYELANILKYGDSGIYRERFMMLKAKKEHEEAKAKIEAERDEMIQLVNLKDEEEQENAERGQ